MARFTLANQRRGTLRRHQLAGALRDALADPVTAPADDPATITVGRDEAERVLAAMRALTDIERELVTLVSWDGLSLAEAAKVLGLSATVARVRLHRTRRRLKRVLDEPPKHQRQTGHVFSDGHPPVPVRESS